MAKNDFIPPQDPNYMTWHDQFKSGVLAQAATFGLVAADTTPITADNTDFHTKITNLNATEALGALLGIIGPDDATDLTTSQPDINGNDRTGGQVEIGFNKLTSDGVNIYSKRDGDVDFVFLACGAAVRRRRARDTA